MFYPNENYEQVQAVIREYSQLCVANRKVDKDEYEKVWVKVEDLRLVVTPEDGLPFEPVGGVSLVDYAEELEDETGREISVLGLPHETFIEYFHEAYGDYWRQS